MEQASEQHERFHSVASQMLGEDVRPGDAAVLQVAVGLDAVLDRVVAHVDRLGRAGRQRMQRPQMLEVDAVAGRDPGRQRPHDGTGASLDRQVAFGDAGNAGRREQRFAAVERPDQAPGLSGRKRENPRAGRDLVAGRDMRAYPRAVEAPMMVGAAEMTLDHLALGQVGAEMRTTTRSARTASQASSRQGDDACAEESRCRAACRT